MLFPFHVSFPFFYFVSGAEIYIDKDKSPPRLSPSIQSSYIFTMNALLQIKWFFFNVKNMKLGTTFTGCRLGFPPTKENRFEKISHFLFCFAKKYEIFATYEMRKFREKIRIRSLNVKC